MTPKILFLAFAILFLFLGACSAAVQHPVAAARALAVDSKQHLLRQLHARELQKKKKKIKKQLKSAFKLPSMDVTKAKAKVRKKAGTMRNGACSSSYVQMREFWS